MERFKYILLAGLLGAVAAFEAGKVSPDTADEPEAVLLKSEFNMSGEENSRSSTAEMIEGGAVEISENENGAQGEQSAENRNGETGGVRVTVIEEKVSYTKLVPGENYYMEGRLYNIEKESDSEREVAKAFCSFIPAESSGTVVLEYRVDVLELPASGLVSRISLDRMNVWYPEERSDGEGRLGPATTREPVANEEEKVPDL